MAAPTAEAQGLTLHQAAEAIATASRYEEPLRRRAEGATWMAWGVALAGMNLHYGLVYAIGLPDTGVWAPWLLLAVGLSLVVRRIASAAAPAVRIGWRAGTLAVVGLVALLGSLYAASTAAGAPPESNTLVGYTLLGGLWVVFAAWNPHRATRLGRKVMVAIGVASAGLGAIYASFVPFLPPAMWPEAALVAALIGGGPPAVAGFWQAMRG